MKLKLQHIQKLLSYSEHCTLKRILEIVEEDEKTWVYQLEVELQNINNLVLELIKQLKDD